MHGLEAERATWIDGELFEDKIFADTVTWLGKDTQRS